MNMTRRSFLKVVTTLPLGAAVLAACGSNSGSVGMPGMNHGGGSSAAPGMAGMDNAPYDQNFIDMMVTHHQAAIDMAKVAQRKGERPEIKQLAGDIVSAQDGEIAKMKAWRKQWYGSDQIATGAAGAMSGMGGMGVNLQQLENAQPFDKAFIDNMIPHHQSALDMAKDAQSKAEHREIKDLAGQIVASQQREIDQMRTWRAQWFPG